MKEGKGLVKPPLRPAPLPSLELLKSADRDERRLAALALAEAGEDAGEDVLIAWLRAAYPAKPTQTAEPLAHERAREIVAALGVIKSKDSLPVLLDALKDVRLRPPFPLRARAALLVLAVRGVEDSEPVP